MRVSLGAPTPINAFDLNAAALIYQSKAADSKPCLLLGRLHNTVSDERFPLEKDNFTDADASDIDLDALHAPDEDGREGDEDDVGEETMLADDFLLPEEEIDDEDILPLLVLRQRIIDARAEVGSTEVGHEADMMVGYEDEADLMFAMLVN